MSRISLHLDAIHAWLSALQLGGAPLVKEVRHQLDLVDAEDVEKQLFKSPAGFVVLPRFKLVKRADGGQNVDLSIVIAVASKRTASTSPDVDVIERAIAIAAALDDQDFGQVACSPVVDIECRPVLSAGIETKGLAVAAVSFMQRLFRVVEPPAATQGLVGATGTGAPRPGASADYLAGDGQPTLEEQAIIDAWPGGAP